MKIRAKLWDNPLERRKLRSPVACFTNFDMEESELEKRDVK